MTSKRDDNQNDPHQYPWFSAKWNNSPSPHIDINNIKTNQIKGFSSRDSRLTNGWGRLCGDEKLVDHQSSLDD